MTCSRRGDVVCSGQCGAGLRSGCDPVLGFAKCEQGSCDLKLGLGDGSNKTVLRGTYENPIDGDCATYFRCNLGWYKRFSPGGVVECAPCDGKQVVARYVTGGLSPNDPKSCLWECDDSRQVTAWFGNGSGCVFVSTLVALPSHAAGWYGGGVRDTRFPSATCPELFTTEANTALRAGDCLACPDIPLNARRVMGARNCEWQCDGGWEKRGERCVRIMLVGSGWPCKDAGMMRGDDGECVPSIVPWNPAGYGKVQPLVSVAAVQGDNRDYYYYKGATQGQQTRMIGRNLRVSSAAGGVSGRHLLEVLWPGNDTARVRLQVRTEGQLCSATVVWMRGAEYLVGTVCNQSFLVFFNLSSAAVNQVDYSSSSSSTTSVAVSTTTSKALTTTTSRVLTTTTSRVLTTTTSKAVTTTTAKSVTSTTSSALIPTTTPAPMFVKEQSLRVLIGQAGNPGWADGFKTQARFGVELYVTSGARNGSVWVLDRWNCVVREVSIWQNRPGDYRTRVYTVHGLTDKFFLVPPEPKCYGSGSLAGPRQFWEPGPGLGIVLFTDDNGLWQLELESGALGRVMGEGWDLNWRFEADELVSVSTQSGDRLALLLQFRDGTAWSVRANVEVCPDDTTSNAGGDCVVDCVWNEGAAGSYYVNRSTGACVSCGGAGVCGVAEEYVKCTRDEPGKCVKCASPSSGAPKMYVVPGRCDQDMTRYQPPCPPGYYQSASHPEYCDSCPDPLSTTRLSGATRVEQCKCLDGLRLSTELGRCVGEDLYAYEDGACELSPQSCVVPLEGVLLDQGRGYGRCMWECNAGFYHVAMNVWEPVCAPCVQTAGDLGRVAVTRGDNDSPMSCEYL